jgi:hypothetical protein
VAREARPDGGADGPLGVAVEGRDRGAVGLAVDHVIGLGPRARRTPEAGQGDRVGEVGELVREPDQLVELVAGGTEVTSRR